MSGGRSNSFSQPPPTPSNGYFSSSGGGASPLGSPTSVNSGNWGTASHIRGSLSSGSGAIPSFAGKRSSIFTTPSSSSVTLQTTLQRLLFTKQHEEIYTVLHVIPKPKPQLDVLASFGMNVNAGGGGGGRGEEEQSYLLVLTSNNQVKKSLDGFGAPKVHWVKVKSGDGPSGSSGDVGFNYKKFKLLKFLRRIEMSGGSMTAGGGASGTLRREKEEFTLVFRSGDQDKSYQFTLKPTPVGSPRGGALLPSSGGAGGLANANNDRSIFVWFCLEICRSYCGFVPTSNIDTVLYQQLTNEITSYYLADPAPPNTTGHLRNLLQSVSKNRSATADADSKLLTKSKIEEKVVVPSMTQEETALVQGFLKQIEEKVRESGGQANGVSSGGTAGAHSYLNELESYLTHKLHTIEHANIQSLFNHDAEVRNNRILQDDIQTNLLDTKLEEMSLWLNHHNAELKKMKKGMELIEKRNMSLDIQEKNQTMLQRTLQAVLESLKLDPDPSVARALEHSLEHPDFSFSGGQLTQTLKAVRQLDHVLGQTIGEEKELEDLAAVKEQRQKYSVLRSKFTRAAETALESIFAEAARKAQAEAQKEGAAGVGGGEGMSTNQSVHRDLRRYAELVRYLERLDENGFLGLRSKYVAAMNKVYEVKIRLYFAAVRKCVQMESKETRLRDFPEWSVELARSAVRRTEGGRNISTSNNAAQAIVLASGPNAPLSAQAGGSATTRFLSGPTAFSLAWKNLGPVAREEERFVREFFGVSQKITPMVVVNGGSDPLNKPPFNTQSSVSQLGSTSGPQRSNTISSSSAPTGAGRGSVSSSQAPGSSSTRSDSDSLRTHLLLVLFRDLEPELRDLAVQAEKSDAFYTLEMLVQCERMMQEQTGAAAGSAPGAATAMTTAGAGGPDSARNKAPLTPRGASISPTGIQCEFLESIITSLSTHLKLTFTSFIDSEIDWFTSLHPSPKRCGVLSPIMKFPALVDRMENIVWRTGMEGSKVSAQGNARSQAADTSYQKLASALFRWLDSVAKSDEKYTDIVYIENCSYFSQVFQTHHLTVPTLEQFVQKAEIKYAEHLRLYISWSIDYEMPLLTKFWSKLEEQLKSIPPEDIPFASELSKHDLRAITKGPLSLKALQKSLTNVLRRIEKHLPKNPNMVHTVWFQLHQTFVARVARFELLVGQCYQNEKLEVTQQQVKELFETLLPPGSVVTYTT